MEAEKDEKYDQKILKTAIPAFVISALCYAAMWGIMTRTENIFLAGYIGGGGAVSQIRNILICILVGAILLFCHLRRYVIRHMAQCVIVDRFYR